jgi:dipeptidase E
VPRAWHQNTSIQHALVDLLGNPIADSNALYIPTATHANPGGAAQAWNFIAARRQLA